MSRLPNHNARNVLFLGELGQRKGVYDLLAAIRRLDAELPEDVRFFLCGNGEVEKVRETATQMGIMHRIAHVGWIDGEQKAQFLKETMINVLPSYNEGLPMTILETMAYGIPNISTAIASIPEVIQDGENGLLIQPGDVVALENSLKLLCADASLRDRMSGASWRDITEGFAMEAHVLKLEQYLSAL